MLNHTSQPTHHITYHPCYNLDRIVPAKSRSGVNAFGILGASAYRVFSELSVALQSYFFERHGLIFIPHAFESGMRGYTTYVYRPARQQPMLPPPKHAEELADLVERLRMAGREPDATVTLVPHKTRIKTRYVRSWDFPHLPWEREFNGGSAYFGANQARLFRDAFLEYVSQSLFFPNSSNPDITHAFVS